MKNRKIRKKKKKKLFITIFRFDDSPVKKFHSYHYSPLHYILSSQSPPSFIYLSFPFYSQFLVFFFFLFLFFFFPQRHPLFRRTWTRKFRVLGKRDRNFRQEYERVRCKYIYKEIEWGKGGLLIRSTLCFAGFATLIFSNRVADFVGVKFSLKCTSQSLRRRTERDWKPLGRNSFKV